MATAPQPKLTADEYLEIELATPTKNEFFDGEMFAMSGGSTSHVRITTSITRLLGNQLADSPCEPFMSDQRVEVQRTGLYTYPDLTVVCGTPEYRDPKTNTLVNPTVIIEVLSPSTETYDRGKKFAHYRLIPSLQVYVLVSQDQPLIECFHRHGETWNLVIAEGLDATLKIEEIDVKIPLREIYARVEFPPEESEKPSDPQSLS